MAEGAGLRSARLEPEDRADARAAQYQPRHQGPRGNLRARLLLSHVVVIALAVALTFVVALVPVRRSIAHFEVHRLQDRAAPVAAETGFVMLRPNLGPNTVNELLDLQSHQLGARILLFSADGTLLHDTSPADPLPSDTLARIHQAAAHLPAPTRRSGQLSRIPVAAAGLNGGVIHQQQVIVDGVPQSGGAYLVLLAPVQRLPVARELFVPVLLAGAVGVLGAVIATYFLSRSIARPMARLMAGADAVAAGDFGQRIPGEGPGEVGRLVASFNLMVERLRASAESQRHLLANVAHELRTPLTSIQGYAQGLAEDVFASAEERRAAVATINDEAERVNALVDQILQLARLESGQSELRLRPVVVAGVVERVLRRHRVDADKAGLVLEGDEVAPQVVLADESLLDQALDNLIRNAIRHTPPGGQVRVSTTRAPDPDRSTAWLRIRVSDTGSGIPPEDLAHVFDRFYRTSDAAGDPGSGFGLGLAIVREIALRHGGAVGVESELGRGTSFAIELPLRRAQAGAEAGSGIIGQGDSPH